MSLELAKHPLNIQKGTCLRQKIAAAATQLPALLAQYLTGTAALVIWQEQCVIWGSFDGTSLTLSDGGRLNENYIYTVRAFNAQEELYLTREYGLYSGRYLRDNGEELSEYVDSYARLWGENTGKGSNGFVQLKDSERMLFLSVPADGGSSFYGLTTRNYIEVDEQTGQAGYGDYRFLSIDGEEG